MATYDLSWSTQGTDQDQVKDLVVTSFGPRQNLLVDILQLWLLLETIKKTSLWHETSFNHGNLPQDTKGYCLFRLIV
jgi:hypothetical protein